MNLFLDGCHHEIALCRQELRQSKGLLSRIADGKGAARALSSSRIKAVLCLPMMGPREHQASLVEELPDEQPAVCRHNQRGSPQSRWERCYQRRSACVQQLEDQGLGHHLRAVQACHAQCDL